MGVTIATHNGSKVSRDHNIRNRKITDKESHIDRDGDYEIWTDIKPRKAYTEIFGDALKDYNEKQTRADRKITDYYNHVCKDKKQHPVYEMIIGVYGNECAPEVGKEIMREFVEGWEERNPNLVLIGAYYHADEQGDPHVHLDYIPIGHGYKNGLSVRVGEQKAFKEMGFEKNEHNKELGVVQWERRENSHLEALCVARGLSVEHPAIEKRKHVETGLYKATKALETAIDHTNDLDKIIDRQEKKKDRLEQDVLSLKGERKQQKDLQKQKAGKDVLGRPKKKITIDYEEYQTLQKVAHRVEDVERKQQKLDKDRKNFEHEKGQIQPKINIINRHKKQAERELSQLQEKQENLDAYIEKTAESKARKMIADIMQDTPTSRYERAIEHMENVKYNDGTSVADTFFEQERELQNRLYSWER